MTCYFHPSNHLLERALRFLVVLSMKVQFCGLFVGCEIIRIIRYDTHSGHSDHLEFLALESPLSSNIKPESILSPGQTVLQTQANLVQIGHRLTTHLDRVACICSRLRFRSTRTTFSTVWPPRPTRANSRQVVLLWLGHCTVVVKQLHVFLRAGSTYRLVTR